MYIFYGNRIIKTSVLGKIIELNIPLWELRSNNTVNSGY